MMCKSRRVSFEEVAGCRLQTEEPRSSADERVSREQWDYGRVS